jgi:N-acetylated-alpha-linked acidic dipeptidase
VLIVTVLGLFTAKLSESPIIPFNTTAYAIALQGYLDKVSSKLDPANFSVEDEDESRYRPSITNAPTGSLSSLTDSSVRLNKAADHLKHASVSFDENAAKLAQRAKEFHDIPWWKWPSKAKLFYDIKKSNTKAKYLERQFLYAKGLDGRNWFKHVVFAPGLWTGYAGAVFPGLVESIDDKDYKNAERWVDIIEDVLQKAAKSLK